MTPFDTFRMVFSIVFENSWITNPESELEDLQQAVIPAIVKFKEVMLPRVEEVGKQLV